MPEKVPYPDGLFEHTKEWHFAKFVEFTTIKKAVHEPTPHLSMVGCSIADMPMLDKVWALMCYGSVYSYSMGQILWNHWSLNSILSQEDKFRIWIHDNWKKMVIGSMRRCVRSEKKFSDCLVSAAKWTNEDYPKLVKLDRSVSEKQYYDEVWKSIDSIYQFGRYINIRVIEGLRRYCDIPANLYDIRSIGGWSPKKALCYIYPDMTDVLLCDTRESDSIADGLSRKLAESVSSFTSIDYYLLANMLCTYRESFENRHEYPGWSIDGELGGADKVESMWGNEFDRKEFLRVRSEIFPKYTLGELQGWTGRRDEAAFSLRNFGYVWSDAIYDYNATVKKGAWDEPVWR